MSSVIKVITKRILLIIPFTLPKKCDILLYMKMCVYSTERAFMDFNFSKIIIITGHYGSGKTNVAVNIALYLAAQKKKVTVIDLDIVNPYFRTADFSQLFSENDVELKVPMYANSNLDIPALDFELNGIINGGGYLILDVGGDDAGATALGRYADILGEHKDDVEMLYVVNHYRYLTKDAEEAVELMYEIENAARLKCSGIINNSNLGEETTPEIVKNAQSYAQKIAEKVNLPLICTTGKAENLGSDTPNPFPVHIYVKNLWNK